MKLIKLLISLVTICLFSGCAGMQSISPDEAKFSKVYEMPGMKKEQLFDKSKMWFANTFNSTKAVIEYENKENGTIIGRGYSDIQRLMVTFYGKYQVTTEVKNDKTRITFDQPRFGGPGMNNVPFERDIQVSEWEVFREIFEKMSENYRNYLVSANSKKNDNW